MAQIKIKQIEGLQDTLDQINADYLPLTGGTITGSLSIDGNGGTVLDVQGTQGQLFSVTDSLTGDIFSVADISGIPILNVNSSGIINIDGNLGVGVTNPSEKLEVDGNIKINNKLIFPDGSSGANQKYIYSDIGSNDIIVSNAHFIAGYSIGLRNKRGSLLGLESSGTDLSIAAGDSTQITIKGTTGFVGIGTTDPGYKLQVAGTIATPNTLYFTSNNATIQTGASWNTSVLSFNNGPTNYIEFDVPNNRIRNNLGKYLTASSSTGRFGSLDNQSIALVTNNTDKVTIDSLGNVGIGTTNPEQQFHSHVEGGTLNYGMFTLATTATVPVPYWLNFFTGSGEAQGTSILGQSALYWKSGTVFRLGSSTSKAGAGFVDMIRIDQNGNVGIGTNVPNYKLDVNGTGRFTDNVSLTSGNTYYQSSGSIDWSNSASTLGVRIGTDAISGVIDFRRWRGSGTLHHSVAVRQIQDVNNRYGLAFLADNLATNSVASTVRMYIEPNNGDVGIGNINPLHKLDVSGSGGFGDGINYPLNLKSSGGSRGIKIISSDNVWRGGIDWGTTNFLIRNSSDANLILIDYSSKQVDFYGNVLTTGNMTATNFILSSDKTLKNNIKEINTNHIDVNWKNFELKSEPGVKRAGVIAQELEEKHPEFVRTDERGLKSVAYIDLLIAKIAELEARLNKAGI